MKMTLERKITAFTMGILLLVLSIFMCFSISMLYSKTRLTLAKGLRDTATVIAISPVVQDELQKGDYSSYKIQNYAEKIRLKTGVLFVSVIDMRGIRYSHPLPSNIGQTFVGDDHHNAILHGESYYSEAEGTLGKSIRAFEPIYKDGIRVGAVAVGMLQQDINNVAKEYIIALIPIFIIMYIIAVIASRLLAKNIKKAIFGLEPEGISRLLREKEAIINNMDEGLIAVDRVGNVSLVNSRAKEILKISKIEEIDSKFIEILSESIYRRGRIVNREIKVNNQIIMANFYSLVGDDGKVIGAITTFQDYTVVHNLAEELTGIKELTWNLRAQNHEFMNKLHTISGMIQLEEYDEALDYILMTSKSRGFITESLKRIKNPSIQGLIFAKFNKADEAKIKFVFDEESNLDKIPKNITTEELLTVIGNILENSIEELRNKENGLIYLKISQGDKISITVKNNGRKMDDDFINTIFNRGFSTKGEGRGFGLYNVLSILHSCNGHIEVNSDEETIWQITV